jgi:uncharacterized membrane protein YdbT with pleckstrin-like domain
MVPAPHPSRTALLSNDASGGGGGGGGAGPQAVSPELIGAMVPAQILQEDEVVLILTKPSLFYLFYSSFPFLLGTFLLGIIIGQISLASAGITPSMIALITLLVCVGRLVWALLVWTSHIYMLTNRRILTIKGVINVYMFQAQLRKMQKIELYRPLGQRLFLTGTIGFSTAAAAGAAESTWVMIARPLETHEQIMAAIHKAR